MFSPEDIAWLINYLFSFISELMGNMFLLITNFIHWLKGNTGFTSCDMILSSLALCNLGDLCISFIPNINVIFSQSLLPYGSALKIIITISKGIGCCSFWFCTLFCIYCCVKIVRFTHPLLVQLARRFMANVPWLLLASVLFSIATFFSITIATQTKTEVHGLCNISIVQDHRGPGNHSATLTQFWKELGKLRYAHFVMISLVYVTFLCAAVPILITLCRHMKRMGQNADSFTNPRMDAHLGAVKTVASLLTLYSLFYLAQSASFFKHHFTEHLMQCVVRVIYGYFPAVNALILIFGIPRLKKTLCGIIAHLLCSERGGA